MPCVFSAYSAIFKCQSSMVGCEFLLLALRSLPSAQSLIPLFGPLCFEQPLGGLGGALYPTALPQAVAVAPLGHSRLRLMTRYC